jgi:hypothetical protein
MPRYELIRRHVTAYVCNDLLAAEINAYDAALALLALAKLGASCFPLWSTRARR